VQAADMEGGFILATVQYTEPNDQNHDKYYLHSHYLDLT